MYIRYTQIYLQIDDHHKEYILIILQCMVYNFYDVFIVLNVIFSLVQFTLIKINMSTLEIARKKTTFDVTKLSHFIWEGE